jgi:hypothetical protein
LGLEREIAACHTNGMSIEDGMALHRLMASGDIPGIAAAVLRDGRLQRYLCHGVRLARTPDDGKKIVLYSLNGLLTLLSYEMHFDDLSSRLSVSINLHDVSNDHYQI